MMRQYAYVARVFALLIGFYVLCAALVGGLVTLTVLGFTQLGGNRASGALLFVTLAAIFVVIRGVFVSTHVSERDIVGVLVTPAEQPALWNRVRQLAVAVGTRAPQRIYLVPDVNAGVWENPRLLGLIPGRRQMMIGVPLLLALTPPQLDAVLAHELGHYGNRDTRLGGLTSRARQSVLGALRAAARPRRYDLPGRGLFILLFRGYAKLVLSVTQEASRAQEYAADRVAAQIAGPGTVMAALRELPGIEAAFGFYLNRYVSPGLELGLAPAPSEVFAGFARLLAEPARRAELEEMRESPREAAADPYDSHPPMAQRIAALKKLPAGGPAAETDVRAVVILANPGDVLSRVAIQTLSKRVTGKQVASWDGVANAVGLHRAEQRAKPLQDIVARVVGAPAGPRALVDIVAAGRLNEVLDALPRSEAARRTKATGRVAREHAKTVLGPLATGWLVAHLARSGRAGWAHSWADVGGDLRMTPELAAAVEAAVGDLIAVRPDATRLRALIDSAGVVA